MATTAVANTNKGNLMGTIKRLRGSLSNIREEAEKGMGRVLIAAAAPAAGYGTGYIHGWAEREGKDITIGDTPLTWTAAGGIGLTLLGAFGTSVVGEMSGNAILGLGIGTLSAETGMLGYKHGSKAA